MAAKHALFTCVIALLLTGVALGGQSTANLSVTASIQGTCNISTSPVAFGVYDPLTANASSGSDLAGTGTVAVSCTNGTSGTITLGQGSHAAGGSTDTVPLRQMQSGSNQLAYFLYSDNSRSVVWGNTAGAGVVHNGTGSSTDLTVYGLVTKGQALPAGSYSDTVVATITF